MLMLPHPNPPAHACNSPVCSDSSVFVAKSLSDVFVFSCFHKQTPGRSVSLLRSLYFLFFTLSFQLKESLSLSARPAARLLLIERLKANIVFKEETEREFHKSRRAAL